MTGAPGDGALTTGPRQPRVVLSIGKFDGVHAGHRHLAAYLLEEADRRGAEASVLILHPHPGQVLRGHRTAMLTDLATRRERLMDLGVHRVEHLAFTPSLASLAPAAFVERLKAHFDVAAFVVGPDFVFGADRSGTIDTLRRLGEVGDFAVVTVPALEGQGGQLSSGGIRELLAAGRVEEVRRLLRRPLTVTGTVVRGAARGRRLGFPTANLALAADLALPTNGIYAVTATWPSGAGAHHSPGVASVGVRPTFDNGDRLLEVHLMDFEGDLYGRELTVAFIARQRDEERFATVAALVDQMTRDVLTARGILDREAALGLQGGRPPAAVSGNQVPAGMAPKDGEDDSGGRWLARGFDLAAACETAALALAGGASASAAHPGTSHGARHVAVRGHDAASVAAAWLGESTGAARTHVYAAGAAGAHGIIWGRRPTAAAPEIEAVDDRDGGVEIAFRIAAPTGAPSDGEHPPGAAATTAGP